MADNDIDPSIAALLDNAEEMTTSDSESPNYHFEPKLKDIPEAAPQKRSYADVDLSRTEFAPITKYFEDTPTKVFDDPAYYKTTLGGEGESAQRLHQLLVKYLNCTDKKDRTVYRQQMVNSYWEFLKSLAPKMVSSKTPQCKRFAMRYGVVLPSLFSPEQKDFFYV